MTIFTQPYQSFEDEVLSNLHTAPKPGEIIYDCGEFVIVPPNNPTQVLQGILTSNAVNSTNIENNNVKLG